MTTAPSLPRQIGAGVVASLASGVLGGIVLGLVIFAGSLLVEMLTGYPVLSELLDGFGEAVFIYMFAGGAFGLFFGVPYAALLGHGCLWLTRNAPERLMSTSVLAGAVITALIVGVGNSLVQVSDTKIDFADLASLMLLMSVCGAVAGSFAAFIFVILRRAIARPGAPKPDDEVDDTIDQEGSPDHA